MSWLFSTRPWSVVARQSQRQLGHVVSLSQSQHAAKASSSCLASSNSFFCYFLDQGSIEKLKMLASFIDVHLTLLVGSKWVAGRVENADITNEEI